MAAPKGNKYNRALKTEADMEKVYKDYCAHIAAGFSHKSWFYNKDGLRIGWQAMENYIKRKDVNPSHKEEAVSRSMEKYEKWGIEMMTGQIEKCQPAIFQMFMRNKFGWDKEEVTKEDSKSALNQYVDNQIKGSQ